MSKFKSHHEQSNIIDSDFCLATKIKEKNMISSNCDRKYDVIELKNVTNILQELNIKYWLDYGTLLGSYRNKKIINHDPDLDVSILFEKKNLIVRCYVNDYHRTIILYIIRLTNIFVYIQKTILNLQ